MIIKGRLSPEGNGGDFVGSLLPQNRGVRVDHSGLPAFWVEALFEPDDIDKIATRYVFLMERTIKHEGSTILGIYRRLGHARRIAWAQPLPTYGDLRCWTELHDREQPKEIVLRLNCQDVDITITKMRILP